MIQVRLDHQDGEIELVEALRATADDDALVVTATDGLQLRFPFGQLRSWSVVPDDQPWELIADGLARSEEHHAAGMTVIGFPQQLRRDG